ncbi:MAG: DEAD/DEAH box helicase [Anaerolineaceae bacterium]|nr:DEAD/DEAH box helicase [Anaerolineaceae bacterium]
MLTPTEVKARIPRTWSLFFARHGRFTPIQQQAIPPILDGHDTLVIAATASGKTEAVIAPLLERNWSNLQSFGSAQDKSPISNLTILYICPTRALVRDLYERLWPILDDTGITIGMKTGDVSLARQMPAVLLTTPESTDSLLTRTPKTFIDLQAIVLDEIHLFDNTPRGDHLRCLLPRIERIRQYANPEAKPAQRVALSATVPDPAGVAARYLHAGLREGVIVQVPGGRTIEAEIRPLYSLTELITALSERPAYKSLIFCNSREEVEATAVTLRQQLPHHADIFVHYSNLDAAMRRDVEERFAAAATAVCVCTSTLELGVDIGSVDDVVLLGAPPDLNAFMQRIGRGSRRAAHTQALCMPKSPGEWVRFEALLALAQPSHPFTPSPQRPKVAHPFTYGFRPSVLIQQTFSLIKQSPTGSVRLADLRRIAPPQITSEDIRKIVSQLTFTRYLQPARPGEWKPDEKLQDLLDQHEIYTNIGADVLGITAVDAHSGQTIAHTDRSYPVGTVVLFGGQPMKVAWVEKYKFGLAAAPGTVADDILRFRKTYAAVPYMVTQTVARSLGLEAGQMATLPQAPGLFLFHFWGTVWGELLTAVLITQGISAETVNEYCLYVHQPISQLPPVDKNGIIKAAQDIIVILANRLEMGRFHRLLPADVAHRAVLAQLNLTDFKQAYDNAHLVSERRIAEQLQQLLSG